MLCHKDKTFCVSDVKIHTCGRELTEALSLDAEAFGLPVCVSKFCVEPGVSVGVSDKKENNTASPTAQPILKELIDRIEILIQDVEFDLDEELKDD